MKEIYRRFTHVLHLKYLMVVAFGFHLTTRDKATMARFFAEAKQGLLQLRRSEKREPVLFVNTGPGAFELSEILYRNDVHSYDCLTKEITFRDGTSGYYPEVL